MVWLKEHLIPAIVAAVFGAVLTVGLTSWLIGREQQIPEPAVSVQGVTVTATPTVEPEKGPRSTTIQHRLRSEPVTLSGDDVFRMVRVNGFSLPGYNITGRFQHEYESRTIDGDAIVIDYATGLMWQQSGSPETMIWKDAKAYVDQLNGRGLAGFSDWRLPTIEELASLVEPVTRSGDMYIDPIFGKTQRWCWSADQPESSTRWGIVFYTGKVHFPDIDFPYFVRAVRSHAE